MESHNVWPLCLAFFTWHASEVYPHCSTCHYLIFFFKILSNRYTLCAPRTPNPKIKGRVLYQQSPPGALYLIFSGCIIFPCLDRPHFVLIDGCLHISAVGAIITSTLWRGKWGLWELKSLTQGPIPHKVEECRCGQAV